ncbi:28S ribosomal protein S14, mitochondrial isoform X2 [Vombatus ursinus]|uniref:28S ribosomal protein S14, mitochondrial isoform X2 n=1 Tax=Vombatus ursinus TaxID=29139 RepID=UPI000FFD82B0|nr:28S ribosomal protein S14, mitochondrial isoform X2 [Vombatus ursinus]
MAASMLSSLLRSMVPFSGTGQIRSYYVDWRMLRDVKRRKMAFEFADERLRINSLRKNTILPKDLQAALKSYGVLNEEDGSPTLLCPVPSTLFGSLLTDQVDHAQRKACQIVRKLDTALRSSRSGNCCSSQR